MHLSELLVRMAQSIKDQNHNDRVRLMNFENMKTVIAIIEDYRDALQCVWGYSKQGEEGNPKQAIAAIRIITEGVLGLGESI
jgi:hypothetical protein